MTTRESHLQDFESNSADNIFHPTPTHQSSHPNQFTQYSHSLIDSARKSWQSISQRDAQRAPISPADDAKSPRWLQTAYTAASAPRFRRYALIYLTFLILAWIGWRVLLPPLRERTSSELDDLIRIRTLDSDLVPTDLADLDAGTKSQKRLIIVGDVHGCKDERELHRRSQ
jgi:hypothetical protein